MILNELREEVSEAREAIYTIGQTSSEYYQLKVFKCAMGGIVFLIQAMVLGALAFLFLLMASIGAALVIGAFLGSSGQGFLVVGGAYLLVFLLAYLGRRRLERPLLKKFSAYYFDAL